MKRLILFSLLAIPLLQSCNTNQLCRNSSVNNKSFTMKANEELVNATWEEDTFWLITQDTITGDYYFREQSTQGVWQGEIKIKSSALDFPIIKK